ncbi:hypothetical protein CPB86DRAFT_820594 [Serendipita vermifera]|nr:hypothetical protein CPB86DRAFT_820594 [Serendipita vermifera]
MLGDVGALNAQGVYDKLVASIVPLGRKLHRVGILRPKGAFPDVYAADLETRFPDTPVKWLASDDLSYATAVVMSRQPTAYSTSSMRKNTTYLPIGIILANGKSVTVLPKDQNLPFEQKFIFTTSQDNQRTGQAAIKVIISTDSVGHAGAIVEEVGTDLQNAQLIGDVIDWSEYWNDSRNKAYEESADKQQVMTLERNGVIGALPE